MTDNTDLNWISDQLYELLGMSQAQTVNYILSISRSAKSAKDIYEKLLDIEFTETPSLKVFSEQLYEKFGIKNYKPKISEYEQHELDLIKKRNYNESFNIVNNKDNNEKTQATFLNKKRKNKDESKGANVLDFTPVSKEEKEIKTVKKEEPHIEKESVVEEEELVNDIININTVEDKELKNLLKEKDRLERDLLDKRIKEKDIEKAKQKKTNSKENPATAKLQLSEEERMLLSQQLRKMSRYAYLKMRSEQQIDLWGRRLADEKKLFSGVALSEEEIKINEINQKIFELASKRMETEPDMDKYQMPTGYEDESGKIDFDKKYKVLYDRYRDPKKKEEKEDEAWEKAQKMRSLPKYGAQNVAKPSDKYELLIENQIEFVQKEALEGFLEENDKEISEDEDDLDEVNTNVPKSKIPTQKMLKMKQMQKQQNLLEMKEAEIKTVRESLPIFQYRDELLAAIRDYQVLVIVGETGSGKTTQIPQYLHEIGYSKMGRIGVTQPRRVAAMSVAARVSYEMGVKLGNEVGYSIRFEDCSSEKTVIKYMTDGVLLREFLNEPDLKSYSVLIIDEAHERTLHTDIIFGLIKDVSKYRKDLKILISSATIDAEKFREYFDGAPVFKIPGRRYKVDIMYTKAPEADYIEASVITALQIHVTQPKKGDILIFLTGQEEIELAHEALLSRTRGLGSKIGELIILDIYAALPSDLQAKIFDPTPEGSRKVILATNIAETSLTIDGIMYVIDCGFCKQNSFNPRTGMESLIVTPVSKASANQRAGRAGRVGPGKCFRLYTAWSFQHEMDTDNTPEIQRTNLASIVLLLKSLGINDLIHFDFIDAPPPDNLIRALEQLYALGALNNDGDLTKLGRRMAEFPIDPCLAKSIISSASYKCLDQLLTISAMLSIGNSIFYRPKEKAVHADNAKNSFNRPGGDHFSLLTVFNSWKDNNFSSHWCYDHFIQSRSMRKAKDIKEQLIGLCDRVEIDYTDESLSVTTDDSSVNIRKAIASGFFYNCAKLGKDGNYQTLKNRHTVHIHPGSSLFKDTPRWVIFHELVFTSKEFMRNVIEIMPEWLMEVAPHYYRNVDLVDSSNLKKNLKNKGTAKLNK
jgi:pre-mRNA-splicing factor ATP-dependent RNA helicase DHX16